MSKIVVPNTGAGFISPNEDLVGFQTTQGGGLTNTNFVWNYGVVEKIDKDYQSGVFSNPITLDDLNVNLEEAKKALSVELKVYPAYDLTEVTNFTLYGSLTKRFSTSINQIINFFPAAIEVDQIYFDLLQQRPLNMPNLPLFSEYIKISGVSNAILFLHLPSEAI